MSFLYFFLLVPLFWLLGKSANLTTRAIVDMAKMFGLSDFTIGFVILALATSTPEFLIGINSALGGTPELSYGNLIGANIVLISFVIGLSAIMNGGLRVENVLEQRTIYASSIIILLPILVAVDGTVSRLDAGILMGVYLVYLAFLVIRRHTFDIRRPFVRHEVHSAKLWLWFFGGIAGLVLGSKLVVMFATDLSLQWHVAPLIIGFLILGLGTNLPEILISLNTRNTDHRHISFGNVVGSAAVNTLIVGMVAMITPITIPNPSVLAISILFLIIIVGLFNIFLKTKNTLSRFEGTTLIMIYILFVITQGINQ